MEETKTISVEVELPSDLGFGDVARIEDEISKAAGEVLADAGLERQSHERRVVADYSERSE